MQIQTGFMKEVSNELKAKFLEEIVANNLAFQNNFSFYSPPFRNGWNCFVLFCFSGQFHKASIYNMHFQSLQQKTAKLWTTENQILFW